MERIYSRLGAEPIHKLLVESGMAMPLVKANGAKLPLANVSMWIETTY